MLTGVHGLCTQKKSTQRKGEKAELQNGFLFTGNVLTNKLRGAVSSFWKHEQIQQNSTQKAENRLDYAKFY